MIHNFSVNPSLSYSLAKRLLFQFLPVLCVSEIDHHVARGEETGEKAPRHHGGLQEAGRTETSTL